MELTVKMNEPEIKAAIRAELNRTGLVSLKQDVNVELVAGRGEKGHTALITIEQDMETSVFGNDIAPGQAQPDEIELDVTGTEEQKAPDTKSESKPRPGRPKKDPAPPVVEEKKTTEAPTEVEASPKTDTKPVELAEPGEQVFDENTMSEGGIDFTEGGAGEQATEPPAEVGSLFA